MIDLSPSEAFQLTCIAALKLQGYELVALDGMHMLSYDWSKEERTRWYFERQFWIAGSAKLGDRHLEWAIEAPPAPPTARNYIRHSSWRRSSRIF
jgi:hypothetical protein